MKVEVRHLQKSFGATHAVDDISFSFGSGQIFGFVGPNGAGKTTTMRILATLDEPTGGDATIDGKSVVEEPENARRLVGYMPDALPTHADISVADYLDFFARAYGLPAAQRRDVIRGVEEFTRLGGIRDKVLKALSKGMKQRVSLARALLHDPPLLILDEPAAGLDPRARIELRELLRALAAQGKAILISSHILAELSEMCDGAVIIELGKIVAAGTLDAIVRGEGAVARATLVVRTLGDIAGLERRLLEAPGVESVKRAGERLEATVLGGDEECAAILERLVKAGERVVELHQRRAHLEDVFMNMTKGEVQ